MVGCAVFTPAPPVAKPSHPTLYLSQLTKKVSQLSFRVGVPTPIGKLCYLLGVGEFTFGGGGTHPYGWGGVPLKVGSLTF